MSCDIKQVCKDIRCGIVECIGSIGVGHIGGCLSIAELLAVLYFEDTQRRLGTPCVIHTALVEELKQLLGPDRVVVK